MKQTLLLPSFGRTLVAGLIVLNLLVVTIALTRQATIAWWLLLLFPLLLLAIRDIRQKKHAIIRNYPLIGHLRYWLESIRPELRQYFFESDLDGRPFNRRQRSIVYQRAK